LRLKVCRLRRFYSVEAGSSGLETIAAVDEGIESIMI